LDSEIQIREKLLEHRKVFEDFPNATVHDVNDLHDTMSTISDKTTMDSVIKQLLDANSQSKEGLQNFYKGVYSFNKNLTPILLNIAKTLEPFLKQMEAFKIWYAQLAQQIQPLAQNLAGMAKAMEPFVKMFREKAIHRDLLSYTWFICDLLPNRLDDFVNLYRDSKIKGESGIYYYLMKSDHEFEFPNSDSSHATCLKELSQQIYILESCLKSYESCLLNIKTLLQADLFDSELEAAGELCKKGFYRAAGAVAGVVLEKHLSQVAVAHGIKITKKDPSISDLNDLLKNNNVLDIPDWRFIQRLGDLRNLCDHKKTKEPTQTDVEELIDGVDKIIKKVF